MPGRNRELGFGADILSAADITSRTPVSAGAPAPGRADYVTSREATGRLGVKPQTLYAYVSRGWVRSIPAGQNGRKLYSKTDIDRIKARSDSRAGHAAVAEAAMRWGEPVMSSAITAITPDGPQYRGTLAIDLVRHGASFETVAALLWGESGFVAKLPNRRQRDQHRASHWRFGPDEVQRVAKTVSDLHGMPFENLAHLLAMIALRCGGVPLREPIEDEAVLKAARRTIATLIAGLGYLSQPPNLVIFGNELVAEAVARSLGAPKSPDALAALNACLVMCADHELSATTFVARIAASIAADLGGCISAAILAQPRLTHRRSPGQTEDFLWQIVEDKDYRTTLKRERTLGRHPPGFNHPLYPNGDPRARVLIEIAQGLPHQTRVAEQLYRVLETAKSEFEFLPALDVGLAVMRAVLDLPRRSPGGLFVVGRSAGWIAHVLEQWTSNAPLRPRARYVGDEALGSLSGMSTN
jgi:citrate synthase